jgi:tetratricopeptide (TPR) repeat protein
MPVHPTEAARDGARRTYDGYHIAFVLGAGLFAACLVAGFRYTLVEHSALPSVRLNAFDQAERQMGRGETGRAVQQYRMAARISPWDLETALRLARVASTAGTPQAEAAAWRSVLALDARNVEARLRLGQSLARAGQAQEAVEQLVQARALAPEHLDIALSLGDTLLDQGQPGAALEAYRRALPRHDASAELHNALGIASARAGRYDDAVAEFSVATRLSPDRSIAENLERARAEGVRAKGPS